MRESNFITTNKISYVRYLWTGTIQGTRMKIGVYYFDSNNFSGSKKTQK